MSRKGYLRAVASFCRNLFEGGANVLRIWLDEARMIIEGTQLRHARCVWANLRLRALYVFAVLATAGV